MSTARGASLADRLASGPQYLLPQRLVSRLAGRLADSRAPWLKNLLIRAFIARYDVDMSEAEEPGPAGYPSFNAFFTRALRPGARPASREPEAVLSPVDGRVYGLGRIEAGSLLQAKGIRSSVAELLGGDAALAARFHEGAYLTLYLAPRDYHRIHMCAAGRPLGTRHVPGRLFAVRPSAMRCIPNLLARNERCITHFQGEAGTFAQVLVGALIVGRIELADAAGDTAATMAAGQELGRFLLGSTVVLLFEAGRVAWSAALQPGARVRVGEAVGRLLPRPQVSGAGPPGTPT